MVSHDLRNPVATLRGFLDLIVEQEELSELGAQLMDRALEVTTRMNQLVDAVGAYGRARRNRLDRGEVSLDTVLEQARTQLADAIQSAHATVSAEDLPAVMADPTALTEALRHVLDNAVRYHRPGTAPSIRVSAGTEHGQIELHVDDDGPGLPAGTEEQVFEPFTKTVNSRNHQTAGLGLATARVLVVRMGGSIRAARAPGGAGTRITVTLPAA